MTTGLDGRVVLITGAARGLGLGIATRLAADGAHVVCADLRGADGAVAQIRATTPEAAATAVTVDVTDSVAVDRVVADTAETHGRLDVLVNNAGVAHPVAHLVDTHDSVFDDVFAVNVKGVFFCSRAAARVMKEQRGGRIISMASQAGKGAWPGWGIYSASKACVISLTQAFALELAPYGISVNAICPGTMLTDMTRTGFSAGLEPGQNLDDALRLKAASIPYGRLGTGADVGNLVAWLASDDCSFTTGAAINLTGGETISF